MSYKSVLLTGSSGKLGNVISKNAVPQNLWTPSSDVFDLNKLHSIEKFFEAHDIDAIIHCAALSKMSICETNPVAAINTNIICTSNLVNTVLKKENKIKKKIRFVHISTDGVYPCTKGNYSELDPCIPYNNYGWSKLGAECSVNLLSNFCIIRTRFFDPDNIPFDESATDSYTSTIPIKDLSFYILEILDSDFVGTVNIGTPSQSEFDHYKKFKPTLKSCKRNDILKNVVSPISKDSSLDLSLWNHLKSRLNKI